MASVVSLLDLAKRKDPDGKVAAIVESMNETNEVLTDMQFKEGNLDNGNLSTIRTGLPAVTWRKLYGGVQPSKSTTEQVTDTCGMLEAYSEVDEKMMDMESDKAGYRFSEDLGFLEAMNQEQAKTLFYGDPKVDKSKFMGLAPRFSSLSAANGGNIINAGGAAARTSIWLVVWGANTVHGITPKNSGAGFKHKDLGAQTKTLADGSMLQVVRTHYSWDNGLVVKDWKYVVRIANIDTSTLTKNKAAGADLTDLLVQASEMVPTLNAGKAAFYCNRTIRGFLRRQILNTSNVYLSWESVAGKRILAFDDIPVRRCDQLVNNEAAVA